MSYYDYAFEAPIERLPIGNGKKVLHYTVIILPESLVATLPFEDYPKLRVIGELADHPVRGAWNPIADGRKYFILSQKFLQKAELAVGTLAEMRFNIDDQDFIEIPVELDAELEANDTFHSVWDSLSSGKKRFYCYQIASAKQQSTRDNRLKSVVTQVMNSVK